MNAQDIGRKQTNTYKLPQGRLRKMVVNGKILFTTRSTLVVEIQGEEFTFNTAEHGGAELYKFVQVSELGASDPVDLSLTEILESKTIQAVAVKVDTHEVVFYGTPREEYTQLDREFKKAQARSAT